MTNVGWECPKCGRCYSPAVTECANCNQQAARPAAKILENGWPHDGVSFYCTGCGKWPCAGTGTGCTAWPGSWRPQIVPVWQPTFDHLYRHERGPVWTSGYLQVLAAPADMPVLGLHYA